MTASPARDLEADYHAWGHSMVVNPWGEVIAEHDETEGLVFADLGRLSSMRLVCRACTHVDLASLSI